MQLNVHNNCSQYIYKSCLNPKSIVETIIIAENTPYKILFINNHQESTIF